MSNIIELVSYKLKSGISKEQLANTHTDVNLFLSQQPGFLYRSCSEDDSGLIYDIVYWQDIDCAKSSGEAFMNHPAGQALITLCDEASVNMHHMPVLSDVANCSATA